MNDYLHGRIDVYCYMVKNGKPAALVPVKLCYEKEAIKYVKSYDLKALSEELSKGWVMIWIYKYPHILEVIKSLPPSEPKTIYEEWILSKLFGYDEESIKRFLTEKGKIDG